MVARRTATSEEAMKEADERLCGLARRLENGEAHIKFAPFQTGLMRSIVRGGAMDICLLLRAFKSAAHDGSKLQRSQHPEGRCVKGSFEMDQKVPRTPI